MFLSAGYGHRCKFGKSHLDLGGTNHNLLDKEKFFANGPNLEKSYKNFLTTDLKLKLRKKQYDFSVLDEKLGPASIDEREWKRIDFKNKLVLAPLTTVGRFVFFADIAFVLLLHSYLTKKKCSK